MLDEYTEVSDLVEDEESSAKRAYNTAPEKDHELAYTDDGLWRDLASCRTMDKSQFFGTGKVGESHKTQMLKRQAVEVCRICPVRIACLKFAVLNNIEYGVWGGYDMQTMRMSERKQLFQTLQ